MNIQHLNSEEEEDEIIEEEPIEDLDKIRGMLGKRIGEGNEIDIYGKKVGKDRYQNSQPLSSRNLNNLNNTINSLFSFGNEILKN